MDEHLLDQFTHERYDIMYRDDPYDKLSMIFQRVFKGRDMVSRRTVTAV